MWRVLLAFIAHRAALLLVAFSAINARIESVANRGNGLPRLHPFVTLWADFVSRLSDLPEASTLMRLSVLPVEGLLKSTHEPYLWINRWWMGLTGFSPPLSLLFWSNIFTLLFLREIFFIFQKMVSKEVAVAATVLVILWPTSYELSLGSPLALTCFLIAMAIRYGLEDQWFITGIGLGLLGLVEPLALGLVPFLGYIFWYFQRHSTLPEMLKRLVFFLTPFAATVGWRWGMYAMGPDYLLSALGGTALADLVRGVSGNGLRWMISPELAGQTASLAFFFAGACGAFFSNIALVHRLLPCVLLLVAIAFTPYASLASRLMIAAPCLEGIASASTRTVANLLRAMMLLLAIYETYVVFR